MKLRTLSVVEKPLPGDFLFESESAPLSLAIRFAQLDGLNHVAVVTEVSDDGTVLAVEAVGRGVVEQRRHIPSGYIVRVGDAWTRDQVVSAARGLASRKISYSWATIVWQAGRAFRQFLLSRPFGVVLQVLSRRRAAKPDAMICSEVALLVLRAAASENPNLLRAIEPFGCLQGYEVSPIDLFRCLLGRRS